MSKVVAFTMRAQTPPTREELFARLRKLANNLDNMGWDNPHLQERLEKRNLSMRHVIYVVQNGEAISGPKLDEYGDWRIKVSCKCAGRKVQVVVAVKESHFDVVTAI